MQPEIEAIYREKIRDGLSLLPEKCNDLFNRMYKSVDTMSSDKLDWALYQVNKSLSDLARGKIKKDDRSD